VDDGTSDFDYSPVWDWFAGECAARGVSLTWDRTVNRGKRHAQVQAITRDGLDDANVSDIIMTVDSDTILDREAVSEGLKPFVDRRVHSVAGMVCVWNSHGNWLARLTTQLYVPFTRGYRSAQSALGSVMVNSGTLAWYRADTIRKHVGAYENETFLGRPVQMNDDSLTTLYGLLAGRAVHQPTAVAFTIVPERFSEYRRQQLRWMRGTFMRTWWWFRYLPVTSPGWWMPVGELTQLVLSVIMWPMLIHYAAGLQSQAEFWWATLTVTLAVNYTIGLRYFTVARSDETFAYQFGLFLLAPVAAVWRTIVLRPMMLYSYATFWRVGKWGTRSAAVPA
jgi:hyaluronan synthase